MKCNRVESISLTTLEWGIRGVDDTEFKVHCIKKTRQQPYFAERKRAIAQGALYSDCENVQQLVTQPGEIIQHLPKRQGVDAQPGCLCITGIFGIIKGDSQKKIKSTEGWEKLANTNIPYGGLDVRSCKKFQVSI